MRPLVAGNWKMNGTAAGVAELGSLKEALAAKPGRSTDGLRPLMEVFEELLAEEA